MTTDDQSRETSAATPEARVPELGAATGSAVVERSYTADLIPDREADDMPIRFDVIYDPANEDQPWKVASDIGCDTHHTLDEVLFWNLIIDERHISEKMRAQIAEDFSQQNSDSAS